MLKFYVLCSREVKKGREREKAIMGGNKEPAPNGKPQGRRTTEACPRLNYRKEVDPS